MVSDLIARSRVNEVSLHNVLVALAEGGFIREVGAPEPTPARNVTAAPVRTSEVDLDFTGSLGTTRKIPKRDV